MVSILRLDADLMYCINTFKGENNKSRSGTAELQTGGWTLKCSLPENKMVIQ